MRLQARHLLIALLTLVAWPLALRAQPMMGGGGMPNMRAISGRPLPDAGMPAGTVSVRVARKMPSNAVVGVEVSAIIKNAGGDLRKRALKTDSSGRVLFEGMAPGDAFKAEVTVDGEKLASQEITMPPSGGVRTMLIAGLGPPAAGEGEAEGGGAAGGETGGGDEFSLGASTGTAHADPSLLAKTLEVHLIDEAGQPIKDTAVMLGGVEDNKVKVRRGRSDATGMARFQDLPTGAHTGYAAVFEWHGMRLGTEPFAMPDTGGMRAEIRALPRTNDPSVVTIAPGARVVLQMHEDTLQFLEMLPLENTSDRIFDPGPGAVEIPLPQGFVSAEAAQSDRKIEVRQNHGMAVHGVIAPRRSISSAGGEGRPPPNEVTFGFVLPYHGDTREFEQAVPTGMGPFNLITEQIPGLSVSGPGVGPREARELGGRKYWLARVEGVPAGGVLRLSIAGLPSTSSTGRTVAATLALALVAAAVAFGRRPKDEAREAASNERERLAARREALFAELVAVEQSARAGGPAAPGPERRRQLVGELEGVYQQLATLDEQRGL